MAKRKEKAYNVDVLLGNRIRIDNAIGMFAADAKGSPLTVRKSGNGAAIPFLKRYMGKRVIVFVVDDEKRSCALTSEKSLAKNWNNKRENEAWKHL